MVSSLHSRPPAASLALRFRNLFLGADAPAPRAQYEFLFSTFLFSDSAAPATDGARGDRADAGEVRRRVR
jgi:hypothetical protein